MSAGLEIALKDSGAQPAIVSVAHPAARISALWRGSTPILTGGDRIFWPDAASDLSMCQSPTTLAVLQHELQHVLDYRQGRLTAVRYVLDPREWIYDYDPSAPATFDDLGAEQRASAAEHLWLAEHGLRPAEDLALLRAAIPWAASP